MMNCSMKVRGWTTWKSQPTLLSLNERVPFNVPLELGTFIFNFLQLFYAVTRILLRLYKLQLQRRVLLFQGIQRILSKNKEAIFMELFSRQKQSCRWGKMEKRKVPYHWESLSKNHNSLMSSKQDVQLQYASNTFSTTWWMQQFDS